MWINKGRGQFVPTLQMDIPNNQKSKTETMKTSPRTTKEALFAEMLGDLDSMLTRIENCEARLSARANALESSGEKYGQAVAAFTEQAKGELGDFIEMASITTVERHVAVEKAAHSSLLAEDRNIRPFFWSRIFEHMFISLLTACFMVLIMYFFG